MYESPRGPQYVQPKPPEYSSEATFTLRTTNYGTNSKGPLEVDDEGLDPYHLTRLTFHFTRDRRVNYDRCTGEPGRGPCGVVIWSGGALQRANYTVVFMAQRLTRAHNRVYIA